MAWIRGKKYLVEVLAGSGRTLGLMVEALNYGPHAFLDFATRKFVQDQPVQLVVSIPEQTTPFIAGPIQRFVYQLDTSDFPDGDFAILYTDGDGRLIPGVAAEFFSVYQGSADMVLPGGPTPITGAATPGP